MRADDVVSKGSLVGAEADEVIKPAILSSHSSSAREVLKAVRFSGLDFLGEAKRLSGRMCSKLSQNMSKTVIN